MEIVLVRHGESEGNADGRMQGRRDSPLSERGREQARVLGRWFKATGIGWDHAYCSNLSRASETARIACELAGGQAPELDPALAEVDAGELSGLTRDEMVSRYPSFLERPVTALGDFAEFGGESYDDVQRRLDGVVEGWFARHLEASHRLLVVAHGGVNFQIVKRLICEPVPRVCILRFGNCTATRLVMRRRRGVLLGEVSWHVPVELMGGEPAGDGSAALFR